MSQSKPLLALACLLALAALSGCGAGSSGYGDAAKPGSSASPAATTSQASPAAPVDRTVLLSQLAAADRVDGKEDHVIERCPGCSLGMNGDPAHAMMIEGYELHACSASCKAHFEESLEANIVAMQVPQS